MKTLDEVAEQMTSSYAEQVDICLKELQPKLKPSDHLLINECSNKTFITINSALMATIELVCHCNKFYIETRRFLGDSK